MMFQVFWGNICQHVTKFFDHRLQRLDVAERHEKLRFTTPFTATRHPEGGKGGETNIKTPGPQREAVVFQPSIFRGYKVGPIGFPNTKIIFQSIHFQGLLSLVSGRVSM